MTDRAAAKKKRPEELKTPKKAAVEPQPAVNQVELERLKAELAEARVRIAELEQKQADVVNRIAWVIDSLHNLGE